MIDTIKKQSLKSLLNIFESTIDETINNTWKEIDKLSHLEALVNGAAKITHHLLELGEFTHSSLKENSMTSNEILPTYIIQYSWMEEAKSFLILWRDVVFQYQKALVLEGDEEIDISGLSKLQQNSRDTVKSAFSYLKDFLENETSGVAKNPKQVRNFISEWSKAISPWNSYKEQFGLINNQCQNIFVQNKKLLNTTKSFRSIEELIQQNIKASQIEIAQLKLLAEEAIELVNEHVKEKPGKLASLLENMESKLETNHHLELLNNSIEKKFGSMMSNEQIPIDTDKGILLFREMNFQSRTRQWIEAEATPLIYEFWETNDQILNSIEMALINVRNRSALYSNELKDNNNNQEEADQMFDYSKFCYPLDSFLQKTNSWERELKDITSQLEGRLKTDFKVSEIYNTEKRFLPVALQSTINQYRLTQNPWVLKFKNWYENQLNTFQRFKNTVEKEDALSVSEKIVRYVQSRNAPEENNHYSNIFLTKGYIGKSFWVGRKTETDRFKIMVDQWKLGFRGAVILSGQRFSGKSLFAEYVISQHFPDKSIRLVPNSSIKVGGRILETTYNLGHAIDFIHKYSINDQSLILIDDFEIWSDPNIPLGQNVRALNKAIDSYGNRMFFLVTMGNWTSAHLGKTHEIQKVFQAEINLDKMNVNEIKEAILIRHGATHKALVGKNNEEPSAQEFQKMADSIYRFTDGNIGESLSRWSYSIHKLSEEKVIYQPKVNYALPDFLNPDSALILSTIMMKRRTNEYRLRKLFGSPFQEKFRFIIQRLISVGILTRHIDGWLEVNELVVNEVGKMLEEKNYLKFHQ